MARIDELTMLTDEHPIPYKSKKIVYFVFNHSETPIVLTTRYVAEKHELEDWFSKAIQDKQIRIVAVWPGIHRSEAFLCNPEIALEKIER